MWSGQGGVTLLEIRKDSPPPQNDSFGLLHYVIANSGKSQSKD